MWVLEPFFSVRPHSANTLAGLTPPPWGRTRLRMALDPSPLFQFPRVCPHVFACLPQRFSCLSPLSVACAKYRSLPHDDAIDGAAVEALRTERLMRPTTVEYMSRSTTLLTSSSKCSVGL